MTVVHIIWHLDIGGGELFLRDLVKALAARQVAQHVFCVGPGGRLAPELVALRIPVTVFEKRSTLGLATIRAMAAALRRVRPDLVHTHGEAGVFWGIPAARLAGLPALTLVYQNYRETWAKMWAARALLRYPRAIVAGSADVARFVEREWSVPSDRLHTIPCGIDPAAFATPRRDSTSSGSPPVLVTVGRLVARKGHSVLLAALRHVRGVYPDVRLDLVGDGPLRGELQATSRAYGVADAVRFLGTVYPIHPILGGADVFVFPSLVEPQGLAVLEAYAAGVPVVASRVGGIPEMLEDEIDGLLVRPGDPADLARGVVRMLKDPAVRERCVAAAKRRLPAFDMQAIGRAYCRWYHDVLHQVAPTTDHVPTDLAGDDRAAADAASLRDRA